MNTNRQRPVEVTDDMLWKQPTSTAPKFLRNGRRRSRQCRGRRARNFARALARVGNDAAAAEAVRADAEHSGALAATQRLQEKLRRG
jgi:hypothetical protein